MVCSGKSLTFLGSFGMIPASTMRALFV
uniref:Uncharacterized protein n=1 Tax=Rhizophora mucronata TaxID=61149 RepID=A0A2P2P0B3_RHIMU